MYGIPKETRHFESGKSSFSSEPKCDECSHEKPEKIGCERETCDSNSWDEGFKSKEYQKNSPENYDAFSEEEGYQSEPSLFVQCFNLFPIQRSLHNCRLVSYSKPSEDTLLDFGE